MVPFDSLLSIHNYRMATSSSGSTTPLISDVKALKEANFQALEAPVSHAYTLKPLCHENA